jgi:uncharacterized protein YxeA
MKKVLVGLCVIFSLMIASPVVASACSHSDYNKLVLSTDSYVEKDYTNNGGTIGMRQRTKTVKVTKCKRCGDMETDVTYGSWSPWIYEK